MICLFGYCISWTYLTGYVWQTHWPEITTLLACGLGIGLGLVDVIIKRRSDR